MESNKLTTASTSPAITSKEGKEHHSEQSDHDLESQPLPCQSGSGQPGNEKLSTFKSLSFLDRFLAIWILLAMVVGVLLGNFVGGVGDALKRGTFVGVSLPIGSYLYFSLFPSPPFLPSSFAADVVSADMGD